MPPDFKAKAALEGIDDLSRPFSKALRKLERQAGRTFGKMERLGLRARRAMAFVKSGQIDIVGSTRKLGRATRDTFGKVAKLTGGVAGVGALAIDQFGKFELAVSRIGNLLDGDRDALVEFGDQLKRISLQFGIDRVEAAEGAYMAFSGGVKASNEELGKFLPTAAKLAKAGNTDLRTAVDALTSLKTVFGEISAEEASDLIFVTEKMGKTDPGQIASSIGAIAGIAKSAGIPLQDVLAAMASITVEGKSTSEAFTQLNAIIKGIQNPMPGLVKNFNKLGVPFGPLALKQAGGLIPLMTRISEISEAGALQKLFGRRQEAIAGATRLTQTGLKPMLNTADQLANSAKASERNWANMSRRTGHKVQQLKVGFAGLFGELGGGLAEGLGLAKADSGDLAEGFISAGKKVRSGAKNFAEGFVSALVPADKLATMNFDDMAKSAGTAFGKMVVGLGKVIGFAVKAASKLLEIGDLIEDMATGKDKVAEAQKRAGAAGTITTEPAGVATEDIFGISDEPGVARELAKGGSRVVQKVFGPGEQRVTGREQALQRRIAAGQAGGTQFQEFDSARLFAEAAKRTAAGQNAAQLAQSKALGLLDIDMRIKLTGEGAKDAKTETKVKAKKGAKIGKVGKRTKVAK